MVIVVIKQITEFIIETEISVRSSFIVIKVFGDVILLSNNLTLYMISFLLQNVSFVPCFL